MSRVELKLRKERRHTLLDQFRLYLVGLSIVIARTTFVSAVSNETYWQDNVLEVGHLYRAKENVPYAPIP